MASLPMGALAAVGRALARGARQSFAETSPGSHHAARVLDGRACAAEWQAELAESVSILRKQSGRAPGLAVVLVGDRPDSLLYVGRKEEACRSVGMDFRLHHLPDSVTQEHLHRTVVAACQDPTMDGVLVQLPLPGHIDEEAVLEAVHTRKDVDGLHPLNVGRLAMRGAAPLFVPCTPMGCLELLRRSSLEIRGKRAVVLGNSNTVGTPLSMLLRDAGAASVTVCHRTALDFIGPNKPGYPHKAEQPEHRAQAEACLPPLAVGGGAGGGGRRALWLGFEDLEAVRSICREADILCVAVGSAELVRGDWIKPGAVVLDVGINVLPWDGSGEPPLRMLGTQPVEIKGDVHWEEAQSVAAALTPVPGGVGPMTIAALLENTLLSASRALRPAARGSA